MRLQYVHRKSEGKHEKERQELLLFDVRGNNQNIQQIQETQYDILGREIVRQDPFSVEQGKGLGRSGGRVLGLELGNKLHNLGSRLASSAQPQVRPVERIDQSLLQAGDLRRLLRPLVGLSDGHSSAVNRRHLLRAPLVLVVRGPHHEGRPHPLSFFRRDPALAPVQVGEDRKSRWDLWVWWGQWGGHEREVEGLEDGGHFRQALISEGNGEEVCEG